MVETTQKETQFEDLMDRLEEIVDQLESGELSLEDAIEVFQEGVTLAQSGHERLAKAEQRIEELTRAGKRKPLDKDDFLEEGEA